MDKKKILITGASGFIGSFIAEEALRRGFDTWVAVRGSSSRRYLTDDRLHFVELDLADKQMLHGRLREMQPDYVVHAAGVTKCLRDADFFIVNAIGTANLAEAVAEECPNLRRFVFISSLSVMGPVREQQPFGEISGDDTPCPNTAYGRSKLGAEKQLARIKGLHYTVLRPTGVYGPREKDYFMMAKSIKGHVDFAAGLGRQDLTFVYVQDVVQAVFLALDKGRDGTSYFLSDGNVYPSRTFSDLIRASLGNPWLLRIKAPLWLLHLICKICGSWSHVTGRMTALNDDKYNIMKQRNWRCDIEPARRELGYEPAYPLQKGVPLTIDWYKKNGWL